MGACSTIEATAARSSAVHGWLELSADAPPECVRIPARSRTKNGNRRRITMRKKLSFQSGVSHPRALLALVPCSGGGLLAMMSHDFSTVAYDTGTAKQLGGRALKPRRSCGTCPTPWVSRASGFRLKADFL
jgi:hypothetical protein